MSNEPEIPVWTDERIREAFIYDGGESEYHDPISGAQTQRQVAGGIFDTWLAAHDAALTERLTAPPTDDEREALRLLIHQAMVTTGLGFAVAKLADYEQQTYDAILDRSADTILAAGFRRQGPITDAAVEAAWNALPDLPPGWTENDVRAALEAARKES